MFAKIISRQQKLPLARKELQVKTNPILLLFIIHLGTSKRLLGYASNLVMRKTVQWYLLTGAGERDDIGDTDPPETLTYEPTHEILVLIALLNNQGTGELVQNLPPCLHIQNMDADELRPQLKPLARLNTSGWVFEAFMHM